MLAGLFSSPASVSRVSRTKAVISNGLDGGVNGETSPEPQGGFYLPKESAAHRIDAWSEGLESSGPTPILGVGYLTSQTTTTDRPYSFVLSFAELGAVGYLSATSKVVAPFCS